MFRWSLAGLVLRVPLALPSVARAAQRPFATKTKTVPDAPTSTPATPATPSTPSTRLHKLKKAPLDLKLFLQRARVIGLYRSIVRGARQISDPATRAETVRFVRAEFERHRHEADAERVRYLLSTGKSEWETAARYFEGM